MQSISDSAHIRNDRAAEVVLGKKLLVVHVSAEEVSRLKAMLGLAG